jgi:hypothetical protein
VLVEEDGAITGGSGQIRYVWLVNDDGTRTSINQRLIAEGFATTGSLPADARFGAWLLESQSLAEDAEIGLWGGCDEDAQSAPESTPESDSTSGDEAGEESDSGPAPAPPRTTPESATEPESSEADETPTPER